MAAKKDIIDLIADEYSDDLVVDKEENVRNWVDSGNYALNKVISGDYFKGYPCGKIVELFGDPSAGKSYLIYTAIAQFQKKFADKAIVLLDDAEDSLQPAIADIVGMNRKRMPPVKASETVEDHFELFFGERHKEKVARKGLIQFTMEKDKDAHILLALDSVAILSTRHEQQVGFDKDDITKSKKIRAGIRMNWRTVADNDVLYMVANHVISQITTWGGGGKTTPGGKMLPFMSSVRLDLAIAERLDPKEVVPGITVRVIAKKNKVAQPYRMANVYIDFAKGMDRMSGLLELMLKEGDLRKSTGGYLITPSGQKIKEDKFNEEAFLKLMDDPNAQQAQANAKE